MTTRIAIIGAGKVGRTCADLLSATGQFTVTLADSNPATNVDGPEIQNLNAADETALTNFLAGQDMVLSAAPFHLSVPIAKAAKAARVHYFDLTEDVSATKTIAQLAEDATTAFVPQCGLAPGFVSIMAGGLVKQFDKVRTVKMRVGALPQYPSNAFKYNMTWSTEGLVNEYCHPCEALEDGNLVAVPALEGLEELTIEGTHFEAFNTSGGLGTLCDTLQGKVEQLTYKSIRYPGHNELMRALLHDLRLGEEENRALLCRLMDEGLPATAQDVVVILVEVAGWRDGHLTQEAYVNQIYPETINGKPVTAIQLTTASSVCAVIDMMRAGHIRNAGFIRQEEVEMNRFLQNRFGAVYALGRKERFGAAAE